MNESERALRDVCEILERAGWARREGIADEQTVRDVYDVVSRHLWQTFWLGILVGTACGAGLGVLLSLFLRRHYG